MRGKGCAAGLVWVAGERVFGRLTLCHSCRASRRACRRFRASSAALGCGGSLTHVFKAATGIQHGVGFWGQALGLPLGQGRHRAEIALELLLAAVLGLGSGWTSLPKSRSDITEMRVRSGPGRNLLLTGLRVSWVL